MGVAVSFVAYTPPARFDDTPWTDARIEEAATEHGTYALIDTLSLGTPDLDPTNPDPRSFTTVNGTAADLWYRVIFVDAVLTTSEPTVPIQNTTAPSGRDLCTLADVISYVPAYLANDTTNAKLQQLLSAESDLIHDEVGREIVAKATQPATRQFEISTKAAQLRQVNIGDLATTAGLVVSILNWDGTVERTVDLSAIVPLYEGERQPTRDWEPVTELYFPWGRPQMPVFIPLQALQLVGTFGFPQIPRFVREACAKRVIIRYVSDVAHVGTDFANAVEVGNLNLAAMFDAAEDAIRQLSGRVVLA